MAEQSSKPLFDLTLTQEQQLMRESVRKFARQEMRTQSRASDEAGDTPETLYEKSLELGWNAVQLPEAIGGFGAPRSPISNMLLAEDLAYGDMSMAIGALSSLSFINTVLDQGTPAQHAALLAPFAADGFKPAALALLEPGARFNASKLKTKAARSASGYVLRGEKTMVPFGARADQLLVIAELEDKGPAAFVISPSQRGVRLSREAFMGLRALSLSRLVLEDVTVPETHRLGEGKPFDLQRLIDLCSIGSAALATGVSQAVLDYVIAYCNDRVAFGEPITHRQSVAFMIADIAIELDGLRLLTYRAASRAEQGLPFQREAYLARLQAADKGMKIGTDGVQLLGGHGFIREHMVELWYRNLRAVSVLEGCISV
ncbi:MAG TPA: acyl-CoA dehydrogenase family protein [Polyangiales bacterium]|nr:acyl-CoA dehydrogenase family protein [Polyangiales bacterium]